ncbi:UNVERIFIED_CONTAM: hypothetical protein NCL1_63422 [Trichonephila clavipes]
MELDNRGKGYFVSASPQQNLRYQNNRFLRVLYEEEKKNQSNFCEKSATLAAALIFKLKFPNFTHR